MRYTILLLLGLVLSGCSTTPRTEPSLADTQPPANTGAFHDWLVKQSTHPQAQTGFRLLSEGEEAYRWRVKTARLAQERLKVQYYIWQDDNAGRAIMAELIAAAERGVKVSILLDDMDVRGSDSDLALLDSHPNISVRVFNPFRSRWSALRLGVEFVFRGSKLNHRMHNKAWVADGYFAIIGGRNIGNEYFNAGDLYNFSDLDIAMVGPVALKVDHAFTRYWNSQKALPVSELYRVNKRQKKERKLVFHEFIKAYQGWSPQNDLPATSQPIKVHLPLAHQHYAWTDQAELVVDDPAKAERKADLEPGVTESLTARFENLDQQVKIISPYFVPGREGTKQLVHLQKRGVEVNILTNSLATNDVAFAHSGYARRRQKLLEGGVSLYELRPTAWSHKSGSGIGLGSSRASLHTKALLLDNDEIFIGSFNLDPRSANINTELGVYVSHPLLFARLNKLYKEATTPEAAFHLRLDDNKRLLWHGNSNETWHSEPKASFWQRFLAGFARLLPIESQL